MNADLENELEEMGPEYRAVVGRLRAAKTIDVVREGRGPRSRSTAEWLVAASLLTVVGLSVVFMTSPRPEAALRLQLGTSTSYGAPEYRASVSEMIASQHPDGGWQNDFLTRRNAAVLAKCDGAEARIAYKKAMRNLRAKGIL